MRSFLILATMLLAGLLASCAADDNQTGCPESEAEFTLPQDEAPHSDLMEWWYYTGHLWTQDGRRYGFEVSFFQVTETNIVGYAGHFAISDPQEQKHHYDQRLTSAPQIFRRFNLKVGDWSMGGNGSIDWIQASMEGFAVDLELVSEKPPAIHNMNGLIPMGGGMNSYYYSKTRLEVSGHLTVGGVREPVTGTAWSDHQWGDFEVFASDGWDWFSIQLDDLTEIMIFMLHFKDQGTQLTGATFVDPDGCAHDLDEIQIERHSSWESPLTGAIYPLDWDLSIPSRDIQLSITPVFQAQEMDTRQTTFNVYWEGETLVSGTRAGREVEGFGYVELTGYGPWGP